MVFQLMAVVCLGVGLLASSLIQQPMVACGAFIGGGLFAIASAIQARKGS